MFEQGLPLPVELLRDPPKHRLGQFILKTHSGCDLACPGCFIYNGQDTDWKGQPVKMSAEVASYAAKRIAEHATSEEVEVVFYGGESLLSGASYLVQLATIIADALPSEVDITFGIQTNGMRLAEKELDVLSQSSHTFQIGVSLDGKQEDNDRMRPMRSGKGSFAAVASNIRLLSQKYRNLFHGLLCTVNPDFDPLETYSALMDFNPPKLDFLLPHASWDAPPRRRNPDDPNDTTYADWLIPIHDRWSGVDAPPLKVSDSATVGIRLFDAIRHKDSWYEGIGLAPMTFAVIDTDGSIRQVDSLKWLYPSADQTGMDVFNNSFDEALTHPGFVARQIGKRALSKACQKCPLVRTCGGGHYVHRYSQASGFHNPSVYCADLLKLISHIQGAGVAI